MPSEANNTTDEFSPVLRRHLREQVSLECAGFDADLASAYLEQSLAPLTSRQYEDHLNGCPPCRGHLLQLVTLADFVRQASVPDSSWAPATIHHPTPALVVGRWRDLIDRLRDSFVAPFRVPAIGMALTVTALVAGFVAWQFRPDKPEAPGEMAAITPSNAATSDALPVSVPTPAEMVPETETLRSATIASSVPTQPSPGRSTIPGPTKPSPSATSNDTIAEATTSPQSLPLAPAVVSEIDIIAAAQPGIRPQSVSTGAINVNTQAASQLTRPKSPKSAKSVDDSASFQVPDIQALRGFVSPRSRRTGTVAADNIRVIRDKTFVLEGRTWVDQEFHQLMRSSGSVTLVHGDETHDRLVAEHPPLADFFNLRPVTVVWNGRVYRVLVR